MNELVAQVEKSLEKKLPAFRLPYFLGYTGGLIFDALSKVTGKKYPVSSVRVKKFCLPRNEVYRGATTQFDATKAHNCGFPEGTTKWKALYSLTEGLHNILHYEFIKKQKDGITFESE